MWQRGRVTALHIAVLEFISSRVNILNFFQGLKLGRMMGNNLNCKSLHKYIPGLNPGSLHIAFVVKIYKWLITINPSNGDIKPGSLSDVFQ